MCWVHVCVQVFRKKIKRVKAKGEGVEMKREEGGGEESEESEEEDSDFLR